MDGRDPYLVWNCLDDHYVPLDGGGEALPPPYPSRLYAVLKAFGDFEFKFVARLAGAKFEGDDEKARASRRGE